ncbi:hypothetical protein [uncultured Muribaculum sp.]|uniref:hypothetical protein n=1 Tax=uncultured Muribaculum sp. TaxID=1918613 RepID=UPI0025D1D657|nr:hypothetical protein [uncultured Muribaculum sp.]
MKKTLKWALLMSLCAVLFSALMVSCGGDDDKDDDADKNNELLVGTWSESGSWNGSYGPDSNGNYNYGYIFNADGTYVFFGSGKSPGTYTFVDNKLILTDKYSSELKIVKTLNENVLVLVEEDEEYGDEVYTYYRVNEGSPDHGSSTPDEKAPYDGNFYGTWHGLIDFDEIAIDLTFKKDGTYTELCYGEESRGRWLISGNQLTISDKSIIANSHGTQYKIVSCTASRLNIIATQNNDNLIFTKR